MIVLDGVYYSYDGIYSALRGVSLQIDAGERVAIVGTNGAGKTTLIKHFNGLLRPQRGHVFLDGQDTSTMSVAEMSRVVGLVFQNPDHQLFLESCRKEVEFSLKSLGYPEEEIQSRSDATLEHLGLLDTAERSPFTLSGGERKRVALAAVLATGPRVLALDEPTIGQDAKHKEQLAEMLMEMNKGGRTVIVITHDIEFVVDYFPRTIAMSAGRIIADGKTESVLSNGEVIERCALAYPQITQAAIALSQRFNGISCRTTTVTDIVEEIVKIIGGS